MAAKRSTPRPATVDVEIQFPESVRGNSHRGAYRKGFVAGYRGRSLRSNPYTLKESPVVRGLHYTWIRGFEHGVKMRPPSGRFSPKGQALKARGR